MAKQTIDAPGPKRLVLFISNHNSARSQMAEALLRAKYGNRYDVHSAGVELEPLNPLAVKVMQEIGLDISHRKPKSVDGFIRPELALDTVVTLCDTAARICPFLPAPRNVTKIYEDPARFGGTEEEQLNRLREMRDDMARWIESFFKY
ncbi:MAG: arsenate reductase ArsC [Euryarchaeota archaeon]|nr:arsenate reductase ArsC [Euryarchaeota archaeon]